MADAVIAGAKLLDSEVPGWWNMVSVETLDLSSNVDCVLGQIYGSYGEGCRALFDGDWALAPQKYGFFAYVLSDIDFDYFVYEDKCAALALAWSYEINARILAEMVQR